MSSEAAFPHDALREYPGLTKRELFAAMSVQGIIAAPGNSELSFQEVAECSVKMADALLAELSKPVKA